jgi:hypothetical protein
VLETEIQKCRYTSQNRNNDILSDKKDKYKWVQYILVSAGMKFRNRKNCQHIPDHFQHWFYLSLEMSLFGSFYTCNNGLLLALCTYDTIYLAVCASAMIGTNCNILLSSLKFVPYNTRAERRIVKCHPRWLPKNACNFIRLYHVAT